MFQILNLSKNVNNKKRSPKLKKSERFDLLETRIKYFFFLELHSIRKKIFSQFTLVLKTQPLRSHWLTPARTLLKSLEITNVYGRPLLGQSKWSRIFYFEIHWAPSEIPANMPGQFTLSGQIFLHWAAATLKGLCEFQNSRPLFTIIFISKMLISRLEIVVHL